MGHDIVLDVPSLGALPAYLALADTAAGPRPAVVVVHEAFGLVDDIRVIADRFASAGFHAIAPDLLSYGGMVRCLVTVTRALSAGQGRPFDEILAARDHLAALPECTGAVGIAGFCLGGSFALLMSTRGFGASAVQYGRLPKALDAAVAGACPVVASYGGRDGSLRGAAATLYGALERADVVHDVKEYPEAGHSFMGTHPVPLWMRPMTIPMHSGYVDTAATDAWDRILTMFTTSLVSSPPA